MHFRRLRDHLRRKEKEAAEQAAQQSEAQHISQVEQRAVERMLRMEWRSLRVTDLLEELRDLFWPEAEVKVYSSLDYNPAGEAYLHGWIKTFDPRKGIDGRFVHFFHIALRESELEIRKGETKRVYPLGAIETSQELEEEIEDLMLGIPNT